jgi:hypothetical protein
MVSFSECHFKKLRLSLITSDGILTSKVIVACSPSKIFAVSNLATAVYTCAFKKQQNKLVTNSKTIFFNGKHFRYLNQKQIVSINIFLFS